MNYPQIKEVDDYTNKYNCNSFNRVQDDPFKVNVKIDAISRCDSDVFDDKENINELSNIIKNLTHSYNVESDEDTTISREEISCILRKRSSDISLDNCRRGIPCREISLLGRVLHYENNLFSNIINPIPNHKKIPIRVSNPVYKNFDRDN